MAAFTGLGGSIPVDWVATFTGIRSSTQQQPQVHYDREEKDKIQPYLTPACLPHQAVASETRQVASADIEELIQTAEKIKERSKVD